MIRKRWFLLSVVLGVSVLVALGCRMPTPTPPVVDEPPATVPAAPTEEPPADDPGVGIANPASVYCEEQGGRLEIRTGEDGGQLGVCIFPDGSECEEWAFYRGECSPGEQPAEGGPAPDVSCNGVSFSFDDSLAADVICEVVPAGEYMSGEVVPEHVRFSFIGYALPDTFHEPRIEVYPVTDFEADGMMAARATDLRQLLADRPAAPAQAPFQEGIPFLPLFNAGQMMAAQVAYLDFQNGSGVRFVTQYGQAYWPINSQDMFYTFQGLTPDDQHYVAAIMPVSHPTLPAEVTDPPDQDFIDNFESYVEQVEQDLSAQPGSSFSPDLTTLDGMVQSLIISP